MEIYTNLFGNVFPYCLYLHRITIEEKQK